LVHKRKSNRKDAKGAKAFLGNALRPLRLIAQLHHCTVVNIIHEFLKLLGAHVFFRLVHGINLVEQQIVNYKLVLSRLAS
jgi:hypothetical protein